MMKHELNFNDFLLHVLDSHPNKTAFSIYRKGLKSFSYLETLNLTFEILDQIRALKPGPKDKIALVLDSSPEYAATFFATGLLNIPLVLIDPKINVNEMKCILDHSDAKIIACGHGTVGIANKLVSQSENKVELCLVDNLIPKNRTVGELKELISAYEGLDLNDQALLVYTSGTTSNAKGVMISWENLIFDSCSTIEAVRPNKNAVFLSILPMNHLLEFTGMVIQFYLGEHIVFANTLLPHEISERLQAFKYTDMIVVPLFLRSLMKSMMKEFQKSKGKEKYFRLAMALSKRIPSMTFRRIIFRPVLKKLGYLKRFISGGAPLEKNVQEFFTLLGIVVSQGYGLTETSPVSTVTYAGSKVMGSVGKALPGTEMKLSENGEILIRGPHVMLGYYKRPDITAEVIDEDGWFHTGDVGQMDQDGNLFITGRLKELVVLGNGKKVFPDEVEAEINTSHLLQEIIVVGAIEDSGPLAGSEILCAVVVPTEELKSECGSDYMLKDVLEKEIRARTQELANYKRPTKVLVHHGELPKTSTRKNKRLLVKKMIEEGEFDEPRVSYHPTVELLSNYSTT